MIITSFVKMKIGDIITEKELKCPFEWDGEIFHKYRFMVIAEKTANEFREWAVKELEYIKYEDIILQEYFYQISMD